jgi:hypothetical protein
VWLYLGGRGSLWLAGCHSGPLGGSYHPTVVAAASAVGGGDEALPHVCKHKMVAHEHNIKWLSMLKHKMVAHEHNIHGRIYSPRAGVRTVR